MKDDDLKQAIDACRAGTDDARLPEMAPLAEALQRDERVRRWYDNAQAVDAAIGRAFGDVPVPDGLADRLLAAVQGAPQPAPEQSRASGAQRPEPAGRLAAQAGARPSRRRRALWACGAAIVAAVLCLVLLRAYRKPVFQPDAVPGEVAQWVQRLGHSGWSDDLADVRLRDYRPAAQVRRVPRRWCRVATAYDAHAVAYDLARPGERLAVAFCLRCRTKAGSLPDVPTPVANTAGMVIAVWHENGITYVLAVRGTERRYRQFVRPPMIVGGLGRLSTCAIRTV